jgi:hypothetical protein
MDVDADLIALCDQLLEVVARQEALYSVRRTIEDEDRTETQMAALFDERHDVAGRIMEPPNAPTNQRLDALVRQCLRQKEGAMKRLCNTSQAERQGFTLPPSKGTTGNYFPFPEPPPPPPSPPGPLPIALLPVPFPPPIGALGLFAAGLPGTAVPAVVLVVVVR